MPSMPIAPYLVTGLVVAACLALVALAVLPGRIASADAAAPHAKGAPGCSSTMHLSTRKPRLAAMARRGFI